MAIDIVIPEAGESVSSGIVAGWRKPEGAWVERDEPVLDVETDKITMEVTAPASGALKHGASEGDEVEVGAIVGSVDETASKPAESETPKSEVAAKAPAQEQPAARAASASELPKQTPKPAANGQAVAVATAASEHLPVRATPLAEKMAEERGIDLARVVGTGAGGRIREQDVLAFVQSGAGGKGQASAAPKAGGGASRGVTVERMSPLRQRIAARLVEAQQTAAMLTTFNECDMTAIMQLRSRYKDAFKDKHGVGLGFMSFFVAAACTALKAFPAINSYIVTDDAGKPAFEKHDYCDVAIAVSSPKGLVVPVLRDAQTLSFGEIERNIKDMAVRAGQGKLELSEMQGGTFTITNGGVFGSLNSTPILNPPQSAILGMHAIKNRAVEHPDKPGEVAIRPMMYLALSYDHRIVDGAEAVQFLRTIKECVESPERVLLEV